MVARVVDLRKGKVAPARSRPLPFSQQGGPRRQAPLKTRRRRAKLAVALSSLLLLAALVYAVHFVSYLPVLSVSGVRVMGADHMDTSEVVAYVDAHLSDGTFRYLSSRNIFLYPKELIEEGIVASFPRAASASVHRDTILSQELTVTIEERASFALWCLPAQAGVRSLSGANDGECYAMDDTGFIFTPAATTTHGEFETAYVFTGDVEGPPIGKRFIPGQLPATLALLRILQQETNLIPSSVHVLPEQDFTVEVGQGFLIKASFGQEPATLARNLDLVLSSEALRERVADIEYIDLRFGNRVYYKMKGEEQTNI